MKGIKVCLVGRKQIDNDQRGLLSIALAKTEDKTLEDDRRKEPAIDKAL